MPDQERNELLSDGRSQSPAISSPSLNPPRHRPTYVRVATTPLTEVRLSTDSNTDGDVVRTPRTSTSGHGLGIIDGPAAKANHISLAYGPYTPPPAKSSADQHTPDSAAPLIPSSVLSGSTRYGASPMGTPDFDSPYNAYKHAAKQSVASLSSSIQPSQYAASEAGLLPIRERYNDHEPHHDREGQIRFKQRLGSCFSTLILLTAGLSACLSGLLLVVALVGPRYGRMVHTRGAVTAANAAFITSLLAKAVEISFGTVVIAFLGQALGRRAFNLEKPHGVTLAEISMRNWIMSPGTIVTNWSSVKYAGSTLLGIVSLLSALAALLYTSAATALVQPQLKMPDWSSQTLQGLVKTQFANVGYMMSNCKTPIQVSYDKDYAGSTCVDMEHAAMAYHNYFGYLNEWASMVANGNGSIELSERPKGYAVINDNTTVIAPWVEQSNVTELWDQYELLINNVSMAMPHPGVLQAAVDPLNADIIMQPDELDGLGNYHIRASVPSPVVHVLCVTTNSSVLQPFVYQLWQNDSTHDNVTTLNMTTWPSQLAYSDPFLGHTILHDIFGWGINSSSIGKNWPPVFPKLPNDYNTILNDTNSDLVYGRDSIYILGKGGDVDAYGNPNDQNYALCQLKSSLTPYCSTQYNASQAGGTLEAVCEDPQDDLQYIRSVPNAASGNASISRDWPEVAVQWALSLSFNDGTVEANSSNARLLTQLILTQNWAGAELNPALPSMAEALAVMSGCTLISAAQDSPFVEFWNYTVPALTDGQHQYFNASLRAQQYASGGTANYQKVFFLPLFLVFFFSLFILLYFLAHREWYTDFAEPSNLFSLAVNSPPSKELAGSSGSGPRGDDFRVSWKFCHADGLVFMERQEEPAEVPTLRARMSTGFERLRDPVAKRVSTAFTSPKSSEKKRNSGGGHGGPTFEMLGRRES